MCSKATSQIWIAKKKQARNVGFLVEATRKTSNGGHSKNLLWQAKLLNHEKVHNYRSHLDPYIANCIKTTVMG